VIKVVKKKLPSVFACPSCGDEAVKVLMSRGKGKATVQCAACGLKQEVETAPSDQMVDVYCRFTDRFYGVKEPSAPKQTQTPSRTTSEEQIQSETQEEAEVVSGPEECSEESPTPPQEQPEEQDATETETDHADETPSKDSQV
jgi:transcription elongation factor Elf1